MTEREILLTAATALLLIALLRHYPPLFRWLGRRGLALLVAGSLIPVLGAVLGYATAADRIAFLARTPLFGGVFHGVVLIGALAGLAGFFIPVRQVAGLALGLAGGFALYLLLVVLTPPGAPLLAPFSPRLMSLPVLPTGHPPLLVVLIAGNAALELFTRAQRWLRIAVPAAAGLYLLVGAVMLAVLSLRAAPLASSEANVHVYPANAWLTRWLVVVEGPQSYGIHRQGLGQGPFGEPRRVERWNDQPMLIRLLSDPVVRRFYYGVFRHPVVNIERAGGQVTLIMQEGEDLSPPVPGRTFYLETDLQGTSRFYQLQRFH